MRAIVCLLTAALLLSACSSSSPTPSPTPKPGLTLETQRLEAQATMVVANGIQVASVLGALLGSLPSLPPSGSGPCKNGVRISTQQISAAMLRVTVDVFYDAQCTTILNHAVLTVTFASATSFEIKGLSFTHDPTGKNVAYATLNNQTTLGSTTTSITQGKIKPRNGPSAQFGLSCSLAKKNACGFGGVVPIPQSKQSLGVVASLQNFVASGTSDNGVVNLTAYSGGTRALKLQQGSGLSWRISGGSQVADLAGTFKESVDAKALNVSGSVVLGDAKLDATTSARFDTRKGIDSGVVTQTSTGKRFATFSTDAAGTGTVDYSDASTDPIVFFIIVSPSNTA